MNFKPSKPLCNGTRPFNGFGASKESLDKCGVENFVHTTCAARLRRPWRASACALKSLKSCSTTLAASMGGIVGVYQRHEYMDEMREAISRYEASLSHILEATL